MATNAKGRILAQGRDRKEIPPQEELRRLLDYDPETGILTWKPRTLADFASPRHFRAWRAATFNPVAGREYTNKRTGKKSRKSLAINGTSYLCHRIIWAFVHGSIPDGMWVDHIDQDLWNNRLENLRLVDASQSVWNRGKQKSRTSLPRGVGAIKTGGYTAKIGFRKTIKYLGFFPTPELASQAYEKAAKELHGEYACLE